MLALKLIHVNPGDPMGYHTLAPSHRYTIIQLPAMSQKTDASSKIPASWKKFANILASSMSETNNV